MALRNALAIALAIAVWLLCCLSWLVALGRCIVLTEAFPGTVFEVAQCRSIPNTIHFLFAHKKCALGALLTFFSVAFPAFKLCFQLCLLCRCGEDWTGTLSFVTRSAPYQCLDIFVALILVTCLNGHISTANLQLGFYAFSSYCVLSIALSYHLETRLRRFRNSIPGDIIVPFLNPSANCANSIGNVAGRREYVRQLSVLFPGGLFLISCVGCLNGDLLQLKLTFQGLLLDSVSASTLDIVFGGTSWETRNNVLGATLMALIFVFPIMSVVAAFTGRVDCAYFLQHWSMPDVMALGAAIVLVLTQSKNTATSIPDGPGWISPFAALVFAGYFFALFRFYLKPSWDEHGGTSSKFSWRPFIPLFLITAITTVLAIESWKNGLAAKVPAPNLSSVEGVCNESSRVLNVLTNFVPASLGNCAETNPEPAPTPCADIGKPIWSQSLFEVPWITGLNTFELVGCSAGVAQVSSGCSTRAGVQCKYFPCGIHMRLHGATCFNGECVCPEGFCSDGTGACVSRIDPASIVGGKCQRDTGAKCMIMCASWRNADCRGGSCICKPGQCATGTGSCAYAEEARITANETANSAGHVLELEGLFRHLFVRFKLNNDTESVGSLFGVGNSIFESALSSYLGNSIFKSALGSVGTVNATNVRFKVFLTIPCSSAPKEVKPVRASLKILDPIWLHLVAKFDIAPFLENYLQGRSENTLLNYQMRWGAQSTTLAGFVSQLVANNAANGSFLC